MKIYFYNRKNKTLLYIDINKVGTGCVAKTVTSQTSGQTRTWQYVPKNNCGLIARPTLKMFCQALAVVGSISSVMQRHA